VNKGRPDEEWERVKVALKIREEEQNAAPEGQ
jgi:hypothetical protein